MKKETRGKPEDTVSEELRKSVSENARVSIPVYERAKGRQMQGSKTWKVSEKESKTVSVLAVVFTVMVVLALVSFFLPISGWAKALLFFLAIFSGIGVMGGYMAFIVFRHHEEDPMEMHYYDVDSKQNHITGEGYDNTREISKEEFFGSERQEDP